MAADIAAKATLAGMNITASQVSVTLQCDARRVRLLQWQSDSNGSELPGRRLTSSSGSIVTVITGVTSATNSSLVRDCAAIDMSAKGTCPLWMPVIVNASGLGCVPVDLCVCIQ